MRRQARDAGASSAVMSGDHDGDSEAALGQESSSAMLKRHDLEDAKTVEK